MSNRIVSTALDFFGFGQGLNGGDLDPDENFEDEPAPQTEPPGIYPLRSQRSDFTGMAIIRAKPTTIEEAPQVAEQIKDHLPVIINLEDIGDAEARRIVDFLGGVVYGLNGTMKKIARCVFICAPFDVPIEQLAIVGGSAGAELYDDEESADLYDDEESADLGQNPL